MPKIHFNDLVIGETLTCKPFSFTEKQIINFCKDYDPQYFHVDPERAKSSWFGGLVASGWQTAAMALNVLTTTHFHFPEGNIGLGIDRLRWKAPVRAGDKLTTQATITEERLSASRPGWGITVFNVHVTNQQNVSVLDMHVSAIIKL